MKLVQLTLTACLLIASLAHAQLTIIVTSIPANSPESDKIYIAGNFNDWNPCDPNFTLTKTADGTYQVTLNEGQGTLEYKFTRGNWDTVESTTSGADINNRTFSYGSATTLSVEIAAWKDLTSGAGSSNSTASKNVSILDEAFYMPQLDRNRRIWIYLPEGYESNQDTYPVFYMHDGQNLFDKSTSFAGEWKIDETLDELISNGGTPCIVVGIDNGGADRIDELTPWANAKYGGGDGDKYMQFIVETLKPYIDDNYRTQPEKASTGIMGSSLGGLISYYAGIEHANTFGMIGVFSPSFWFSNEVYSFTENFSNFHDTKLFFLVGEKESDDMVADMNLVIEKLKTTGIPATAIRSVVKSDGTHSEWFWAREFPQAYQWLIGDEIVAGSPDSLQQYIEIFPNPTQGNFRIKISRSGFTVGNIQIMDTAMRVVKNFNTVPINEVLVDTNDWEAGIYMVQITVGDQTSIRKIIIL